MISGLPVAIQLCSRPCRPLPTIRPESLDHSAPLGLQGVGSGHARPSQRRRTPDTVHQHQGSLTQRKGIAMSFVLGTVFLASAAAVVWQMLNTVEPTTER